MGHSPLDVCRRASAEHARIRSALEAAVRGGATMADCHHLLRAMWGAHEEAYAAWRRLSEAERGLV